MSVERAVNGTITDIDQLTRLYHQLSNVPAEVKDLVRFLVDTRSRLVVASRLLANISLSELRQHEILSGHSFTAFRSRLLDFELFLDPEQFLHQSGAGAQNQHSVPWDACQHGDSQDFCFHFKEHIAALQSEASSLINYLNAYVRQTPEREELSVHNSDSPSLSSLRSFALQNSANPSPASTPGRNGRKKRSPRNKTEEELIFDRFVAQYSKLDAPGKRKRHGADGDGLSLVSLDALSRQLPFPFPAGQDELEKMQQMIRGTGHVDGDVPEWNLDDLRAALPPPSITSSAAPSIMMSGDMSPRSSATSVTTTQYKGKQRASIAPSTASTMHLTEYGLTEYNSSSSGSLRSAATREGSLFSISSRDRMYEDGTCKIWHRQGSATLKQVDIARTEVRRDVQQANGRHGFGVTVVSTMPSRGEIQDPLWMPNLGVNSSPFLEHDEIVQQFQRIDPHIKFIVRFAPNTSRHPQYSFTSREDCWNFVQAITEKVLVASIDVESIKTAATHASAFESGMETLQIWEDRQTNRRSIKFFRNKNEAARERVVELELGWLRQPHKERRTQRTLVELRDCGEPLVRELKYLKIIFSNPDAEAGFMHECGFVRNGSVGSISTTHSERYMPFSSRSSYHGS